MNIAEKRLATILASNWQVLLLRGIVAIAFGAFALFMPGLSLALLVLIFGAYCLADGLLGIWTAIAGRKEHEYWWVLLLGGVLGAGVGVLTFVAPGITAMALLFYIAAWAIITGALQIVAALRLRKEIEGEWFLVFGGIVSVAIGVFLIASPGVGALSLLWLIGIYTVAIGVLLVLLSLKVRKFGARIATA